jgi:hypothetical protein
MIQTMAPKRPSCLRGISRPLQLQLSELFLLALPCSHARNFEFLDQDPLAVCGHPARIDHAIFLRGAAPIACNAFMIVTHIFCAIGRLS